MKHTTATISIILIFSISFFISGQVIPKDTIFLEFKQNDGSVPDYRGKKFEDEKGINFNLYSGKGLYSKKSNIPDTLCYKHIKEYPITKIKQIDSLSKLWKKKNHKLLQKKYGSIYPPFDENAKFSIYIIEKLTDCFIVYKAYWRD